MAKETTMRELIEYEKYGTLNPLFGFLALLAALMIICYPVSNMILNNKNRKD